MLQKGSIVYIISDDTISIGIVDNFDKQCWTVSARLYDSRGWLGYGFYCVSPLKVSSNGYQNNIRMHGRNGSYHIYLNLYDACRYIYSQYEYYGRIQSGRSGYINIVSPSIFKQIDVSEKNINRFIDALCDYSRELSGLTRLVIETPRKPNLFDRLYRRFKIELWFKILERKYFKLILQ